MDEQKFSLLSDKGIVRNMELGNVIIEPFVRENLSTSSYDVTLGPNYFRETSPEPGQGIYNPFSESMVQRVWGKLQHAELVSDWYQRTGGNRLENISDDDRVIWIAPGETILAHTNEFIGGRNSVTTMMKARSSLGRNFIEVCKCAGWGDIGYTNRWTMEITNNSRFFSIPLIVGRRVAQIIFFDSEGTLEGSSYEKSGKYQSDTDLEVVKKSWTPDAMLPRMFKDREIQK
jgi:dCTP deaminase